MKCSRCGVKVGLTTARRAESGAGTYYCPDCHDQIRQQAHPTEEAKRKALKELRDFARQVVVTTTHTVDGFYVKNYLGIESIEYLIGTGLFPRIQGNMQGSAGSPPSRLETKLQTTKQAAFEALQMMAARKKANAILGVAVDYTQFSRNRVALIMSGTLVQLAPRKADSRGPRN